MKHVAFVVQRCGREINGGAEQHCLSVSLRMAKYWDIDIITTCSLDYITWENHYSPGVDRIGSVRILRFPVKHPRNIESFGQLSQRIQVNMKENSRDEEEAWMIAQGPWSPKLLNYINTNHENYDAFIFFTYLYATTYFGLPKVQDKAYLVPTAHDEWPIYLGIWDDFIKRPKKLIFNTIEERNFLRQRFPDAALSGPVVGVAVNPPIDVNPEGFRKKYKIHHPYFLYLGRIDPSKGCDQLIKYFLRYKSETGDLSTKLVLIGKSVMEIPKNPDIITTGFVDEQTKWDALAGCELLIMPSQYESLSMVCLEAWAQEKPVLVNGNCDVLVGQCRRSQGGIWYKDVDEFIEAIKVLSESTRKILGKQGFVFVRENYSWDRIELIYQKTIN